MKDRNRDTKLTIQDLKHRWNENLARLEKADAWGRSNPHLWDEKGQPLFDDIVREQSELMKAYKFMTGEDISKDDL